MYIIIEVIIHVHRGLSPWRGGEACEAQRAWGQPSHKKQQITETLKALFPSEGKEHDDDDDDDDESFIEILQWRRLNWIVWSLVSLLQ